MSGGTVYYDTSGGGSLVPDATPPLVKELVAEEHAPDKQSILPSTPVAISLSEGVRDVDLAKRIRYRTQVWGDVAFTAMTVSTTGELNAKVVSPKPNLSEWDDLLVPLPADSLAGFSICSGNFPSHPTFHDDSKCWNQAGGQIYVDSVTAE